MIIHYKLQFKTIISYILICTNVIQKPQRYQYNTCVCVCECVRKGMKLKVEQQNHKIFQKLPHKYEQSKTTADKKSIYLILHIN